MVPVPCFNAWKQGNVSYGGELNLATCKKMLEAGERQAKKEGVPMTIAICDTGGHLLALHRMDDAALFSIQIAQDKAYTAVFGKQDTSKLGIHYRSGTLIPLFFHERWITFPGGFPIIKDGKLIGGIGVSGGVTEDVPVAKAVLESGGFDTSEVDELLKGS
jgi:uncharacterized protein GlcG (DUF336 family)